MRRHKKILLVLFLFFSVCSASAQKGLNMPLSKQIDSLKNEDQRPVKMENSDSASALFQRTVRRNFYLVKNILDKYGFPGYNMVGKESSNNYWLLVQHTDFDVEFQKKALKLMKMQVDKKNASGQNYSYLIDRININEGQKQVYGTQVNMSETGTTLKPCIDTMNLDKRRKTVGLPPIKDYLRQCDELFYEMNKDRLNKLKEPVINRHQ